MTVRRICHLASGDLWAGAEVQTATMVRSLLASGRYLPHAIVLNRGRLAEALEASGVEVTVLDETRLSASAILRACLALHRQRRFSLWHTHRYKENGIAFAVAHAARAFGVPRPRLVQTVHGATEPFPGWRGLRMRAIRRVNDAVSRYGVDLVHTVSHDLGSKLRGASARVVTIHNAARFDPSPPSRAEARRALSLPEHAPVIGALGRLEPVKNLGALLRIVPALQEGRPKLQVVIAGSGSQRAALEAMAERLGLSRVVHFLGFRGDVSTVLAALDVYVMCSRHEGIPTSLLEAMALEVPAVCTRVGGIPEVIDDEQGVLVEPEEDEALRSAIAALLDDPERRKRIGGRARRRATTSFSVGEQARRLLEAYDSLFDETAPILDADGGARGPRDRREV